MQFTVQADNEYPKVDVGTYHATLEKIEEMPPTQANPTWGPSLLWQFKITTPGKWNGKDIAAFTPAVPKENNNLGKLLRQMVGRKLLPNENVDVGPMIGQTFSIVVDLNPSGQKTRVISAHKIGAQVMAPTQKEALASIVASTPSIPAPPKPPVAPVAKSQPIQTQADLTSLHMTAFFSSDSAPSFEATIARVRQDIAQGKLDKGGLQVYIPATTEWIPWDIVDMPF
jgi:hypothetical protein